MKLLTRTQVVIDIVRIVSVDVHIVTIEVDVHSIAIGIARTQILPDFLNITDNFLQNYLSLASICREIFYKALPYGKPFLKPDKQFLFQIGKPIFRQTKPIVLAIYILA